MAAYVAQFYNDGLGFKDFDVYTVWGDHRLAIAWCYVWFCGYAEREIPPELYIGIFNAYAYILDNQGLDPYNDYYNIEKEIV